MLWLGPFESITTLNTRLEFEICSRFLQVPVSRDTAWLSPFCLPPAMTHTPILQLPQPGAIQALSQGCEAGVWLTLGKAKSTADSGA